jgi:hypothetical protein
VQKKKYKCAEIFKFRHETNNGSQPRVDLIKNFGVNLLTLFCKLHLFINMT